MVNKGVKMAKNEKIKKQTITLDDKEYNISDMNDNQKNYLSHISDLNRKVETAKFNLQQMESGLNYYVALLSNSLKGNKKEE
tara:strand:- start:1883 stop:2128 length:246 start_codon:yes stop_codon:yes gene_type:complete